MSNGDAEHTDKEWREWLTVARRHNPDGIVELLHYQDFIALLEAALRSADVTTMDDPEALVEAWVGAARDLARDCGLTDEDSPGSTVDWAFIRARALGSMARDVPIPSSEGTLNQDALDRASFELQRHFGREGSIYGIKACEEIARIAVVAYGIRSATGMLTREEAARVCEMNGDSSIGPEWNRACRSCAHQLRAGLWKPDPMDSTTTKEKS